tara:strand:+ start:616 stop:960 length:345 start_codon:yes stop_codon:yes gene_type:complete
MIFKCKARQLFYKIKSKQYKIIIFFILIQFLIGCNVHIRYPYEYPSKIKNSYQENYWFWGIIGEKNYEVYNICNGGRIYEVRIETTLLQKTFTILSLGIFSPRTTTIVCSIRGN